MMVAGSKERDILVQVACDPLGHIGWPNAKKGRFLDDFATSGNTVRHEVS